MSTKGKATFAAAILATATVGFKFIRQYIHARRGYADSPRMGHSERKALSAEAKSIEMEIENSPKLTRRERAERIEERIRSLLSRYTHPKQRKREGS